jgi:hypothetical protein
VWRLPTNNIGEEDVLKSLIGMTILLPALAVLIPAETQAADPTFCAAYAQAALNQVRGALSNPGCATGAQGPRWSTERHVHFDWCLTQPVAAVEAERGERTAYLRGCHG